MEQKTNSLCDDCQWREKKCPVYERMKELEKHFKPEGNIEIGAVKCGCKDAASLIWLK